MSGDVSLGIIKHEDGRYSIIEGKLMEICSNANWANIWVATYDGLVPNGGFEQNYVDSLAEEDFQRWVWKVAEHFRWLVYHTHDSRGSRKGYPDLTLVRPPEVLFVELKTMTGEPSSDQAYWKEELQACPGVGYYLWRPSAFLEVVSVLGPAH